jgi:hypothetical protein
VLIIERSQIIIDRPTGLRLMMTHLRKNRLRQSRHVSAHQWPRAVRVMVLMTERPRVPLGDFASAGLARESVSDRARATFLARGAVE